jgi:hypothetical protein
MPGPMQVGHGTGFQAVFDQFKPGMLGSGGDQHVRFKGDQLYTHSSFSLHGRGAEAAENRAAKYELGAAQVRQSLVRDFGAGVADRILSNVGKEVGRDLSQGITRSDLTRIKQQVDGIAKNAHNVTDMAIEKPDSQIGQALLRHTEREFSPESLQFSRGVMQFKNAPAAERAEVGRELMAQFVNDGAESMVNLPSGVRGQLLEAFAEGAPPPSAHVFDDALKEMRELMAVDSAKRFVENPLT